MTGYTFRHPDGTLDYRVVATVESAQSNAAFHSVETASIMLPRDWDLAYAAGYRVIPAAVCPIGPTRKVWKDYQR